MVNPDRIPTNKDRLSNQMYVTEELDVGHQVSVYSASEQQQRTMDRVSTLSQSGIYILPNLFTTAALFSGFFSIISSLRENYEVASMAIFFALIFDILDGRVARMTHTESKFGSEYDSLADLVSFGLAPALVMFCCAFGALGKFGWSAAFIYLACTALRLARFNSRLENQDKGHFLGLASPAAACIVASTAWLFQDVGWTGSQLPTHASVTIAILSVVLGFLMISNFRYYSFKRLDSHRLAPVLVAVACCLAIGIFYVGLPALVLCVFAFYAVSGPITQLLNWDKRENSHFGY